MIVAQPGSTRSSPVQVTLASFWKRLAAWVYDLLGALAVFILAIVVGLIVVNIALWVENSEQVSKSLNGNPLWAIYLVACIQYFYVCCWVKGGQTLGMRTWRLKLCKPDGKHLTWKEAYIRSFASLGGASIIWCLFDKENRGLHDLVVNSRVVQLPKEPNKPQQPII